MAGGERHHRLIGNRASEPDRGEKTLRWHGLLFLGQHLHTLDTKGRIILPARFREPLPSGYITCQNDRCLALWPGPQFEAKAERMGQKLDGDRKERDTARAFFSGAEAVTPDGQGRIAIPAHLRRYAGLDKDLVVIGVFDHIEIWDARQWEAHQAAGEEALGDDGAADDSDASQTDANDDGRQ